MTQTKREHLGTIAAADALLEDLYLSLRTRIALWSQVTRQTPQPRMGYIGQHLVSVVTGSQGGRSAARGHDLVGPTHGQFSEIKTCYRVDQLGKCTDCGTAVSSIELECPIPTCGSKNIDRKDDSKWLITPKHDDDMKLILKPEYYYLVLFDFEDLADPRRIQARIWRVDPKRIGFSSIVVDYYCNIRAKSKSKAPFNLWPFSFKFQLMEPELIYSSVVDENNAITTHLFPGQDAPQPTEIDSLANLSKSTTLTKAVADELAKHYGTSTAGTKTKVLELLQSHRVTNNVANSELVEQFCIALYKGKLGAGLGWLPANTQNLLK